MEMIRAYVHMAKLNVDNLQLVTAVGSKDLLAIADAFRALEQRAEAAEATVRQQDEIILSYQETIRGQTAKLAELVPCPYPCGWKNLLSLSMADAAFLSRGLVEGELVTEVHRRSVVSNNDRLITVVTAILRKIEEAQ